MFPSLLCAGLSQLLFVCPSVSLTRCVPVTVDGGRLTHGYSCGSFRLVTLSDKGHTHRDTSCAKKGQSEITKKEQKEERGTRALSFVFARAVLRFVVVAM